MHGAQVIFDQGLNLQVLKKEHQETNTQPQTNKTATNNAKVSEIHFCTSEVKQGENGL